MFCRTTFLESLARDKYFKADKKHSVKIYNHTIVYFGTFMDMRNSMVFLGSWAGIDLCLICAVLFLIKG